MPPSDGVEHAEAPIRPAVRLLHRGRTSALPTDTVLGLALNQMGFVAAITAGHVVAQETRR